MLRNVNKEAWDYLNITPIPGEKTIQLQQLLRSTRLNEILSKKIAPYEQVKSLLAYMMYESDLLTQDPTTKRTLFSQVIVDDYRATAGEMLSILVETKENDFINKLLMTTDCDGNTALHLAVNAMNHVLIGKICAIDKSRELYFKHNNQNLFPLALAFKNYGENRAILPLSIINQLYFSLRSSDHKTQAAEMEVTMKQNFYFAKPLWRHVLQMCSMRDNDGKIKQIDLNLWDFIIQVINNNLRVMNFDVDKKLIYSYSHSYSDTYGENLKRADEKREVGLAGRTLNQAGTNNTLAKNKKFMQLAQLGEAKYDLWYITTDNFISINVFLNKYELPESPVFALVGENLFYIPSKKEDQSRRGIQIEPSENKARFDSVKRYIKNHIPPHNIQSAPDKIAVDIIRLIPLMNQQQATNDAASDILASKQLRNTGMSFLGSTRIAPTNSPIDTLEPIFTTTNRRTS